ncbi:hypothetical protein COCSADRAFT_356602 [Bipolaris sorokiniana ND90Pr]|uniref:Uncharacterized protein n=1 Tax=Cochliobolus sativus (strain ND90Pr / ATCC 201652) TaxID=665912 RepID=M2T8E3_COCSN|nr:uncharacterized protein COCSADRAFT_356602 [Bipolaris sorokiniana ND90Pr]EMD65227.1 hypothetical protein COCSADRAFT_356602 [Bipolaris sorokiniana ND90Pr]
MVASNQSNSIVHAATCGAPQRDNYDTASPRHSGLADPSINGAPRPFTLQCDMEIVCVGTWISNTGSQYTDSVSNNGTCAFPYLVLDKRREKVLMLLQYALLQRGLLAYAIAVYMKHVSSLRHVLEGLNFWWSLMEMV